MTENGDESLGIHIQKGDQSPERPMPLEWTEYSDKTRAAWFDLLSTDPEEREIQEFLELHPSMIPGGSGDIGPGGHHGSEMGVVFRRPRLTGGGRILEPDFMWVTRSSGLITPILIEIEKPSKRWFKQDGRPTRTFTEAHDQLNDWKAWFQIEGNATIFRNEFMLGDQYLDRPLEPQFVLIYGRESEFEFGLSPHANPDQLRRKRDTQRRRSETFQSFDSLRPKYDHGDSITVTMKATGPVPFAFSPTYHPNAGIGAGALRLGNPAEALDRTVMMSKERKEYISSRWDYWSAQELARRAGPDMPVGHDLSRE
jgi:hypothetical protein